MLLASGLTLLSSGRGAGPAGDARHHRGARAGRFRVEDPKLALAVAGGALLGFGQLLRDEPERDDAEAADTVTEDVLRLFGMTPAEARDICRRPLPQLESVTGPDSAGLD